MRLFGISDMAQSRRISNASPAQRISQGVGSPAANGPAADALVCAGQVPLHLGCSVVDIISPPGSGTQSLRLQLDQRAHLLNALFDLRDIFQYTAANGDTVREPELNGDYVRTYGSAPCGGRGG